MPRTSLSRAWVLAVGLLATPHVIRAEAAPAPTASVAAASGAELDQKTLDKRTAPLFKALALDDAAKTARVRAILEPHFQALQVWHAKHDDAIAALWTQWSAARSAKKPDEAKAAEIVQQINDVYASFQPRHDGFLSSLAAVLTPTQIDVVKNVLTRSPGLKRTYDTYLQIIPELTPAQKEFVLEKLTVARERAMDAITDKEKASIFKTQKIQIEAYFVAQGYNWKKAYAAYVTKLNTQAGAPKTEKPANAETKK
jgi:O6-methylguanine-DNA--protein-cysteine methyltransferase